jgi:hypothetical protein
MIITTNDLLRLLLIFDAFLNEKRKCVLFQLNMNFGEVSRAKRNSPRFAPNREDVLETHRYDTEDSPNAESDGQTDDDVVRIYRIAYIRTLLFFARIFAKRHVGHLHRFKR